MEKVSARIPNRVFKFSIALWIMVFALLVGRTLWELRTIDTTINPTPRAQYRTDYRFALLIPGSDHDSFYSRSIGSMRKTAEKEHAALEIFQYPSGEGDEIHRFLRLILNINPDGAVISVPEDPLYEELLKSFADRNIPLVTLEYDAAYRDAYVGSNPFDLGRLAGEAALILDPGGSAAVLLSGGGDADFIQGFRQALREKGTMNISMVRSYDDSLAAGEEFIREILRSHQNISIAVFTGSREAEGAAQALIEYGRVGAPLIIASEDNPEIRRLMDMGVISAAIVRNPENTGRAVVEALCALSRKERTNAYVDPGSFILWAADLDQTGHP